MKSSAPSSAAARVRPHDAEPPALSSPFRVERRAGDPHRPRHPRRSRRRGSGRPPEAVSEQTSVATPSVPARVGRRGAPRARGPVAVARKGRRRRPRRCAREARTSSRRARSVSCSRTASSARRRSVMSKMAPSSHTQRRTVERGQRYVGVLTDGHAWALFHAPPDGRRPRSHSSERGNALAPLT